MNLKSKWMIVVLCLACFLVGLSGSLLRTNAISDKIMHGRYQDRFAKLKEQRQDADDQYQKEHQKRLKAQSQIDSAKQSAKDAQSSADQRVQSMIQLSSEIKANASQLQQEELKVANKYYSKQSSSDALLIPLTKINWKMSDIDDGGLLSGLSSDNDSEQKIVDSISFNDPYTGKSSTINYQNDGTVDSVSGAWGVITDISHSSHTDDLLKLSRDGRLYKKTSRKIKVNDQRLDGQRLNLLVSRPAGSDRDAPWVVQRVKFVHDKGGIKP